MTPEYLTNLEPKLIKHNNSYYYVKFDYLPISYVYIICLYTIPEEHIDTDFDILLNKGIIKRICIADLEKIMDKVTIAQRSVFYIIAIVETFFKMSLEQKEVEKVKDLQFEYFERWDGVIGENWIKRRNNFNTKGGFL